MFPALVHPVILVFVQYLFRPSTFVPRIFAMCVFVRRFDEDDGGFGNEHVVLVICFFCSVLSTWFFMFMRIIFATGRTKRGEFRARWVKTYVNKNESFQFSRFRSNTSSKEPLDAISVSTSSMKEYDALLKTVFRSSNPTKMTCDSASSATFRINGPACSEKMRISLSSAVLFLHCVSQFRHDGLVGDW